MNAGAILDDRDRLARPALGNRHALCPMIRSSALDRRSIGLAA